MNKMYIVLTSGIWKSINDKLTQGLADLMMKMYEVLGDLINGVAHVRPKDYGMIEIINAMLDPIMGFGTALCMVFFLIHVLDSTAKGQYTLEAMARPFMNFLISVGLIINTPKITEGVWNIGLRLQDLFISQQNVASDMIAKKAAENADKAQNAGVTIAANLVFSVPALLLVLLFFLIVLILALVMHITVYLVNFKRLIQLAVYGISMPIGIGVGITSGLDGAIRYIKKYTAVAITGALYTLIMAIFGLTAQKILEGESFVGNSVNGNLTLNAFTGILPLIAFGIATISAMFKADQWANDIMGV